MKWGQFKYVYILIIFEINMSIQTHFTHSQLQLNWNKIKFTVELLKST